MQRPTSVTVLGILNILFGVFGILGSIYSLVSFGTQNLGAATGNPVFDIMAKSPALATWTRVSTVLGIFAAIAEMISGVGMLQLREWGRKLAVGVALYLILLTVIGFFANLLLLIRPLLDAAGATNDPAMKAGAYAGAFAGFFGGCSGLIYPAILLFFMTRPEVAAAFMPPAPTAHSPIMPDEPRPPEQPFSGQSF